MHGERQHFTVRTLSKSNHFRTRTQKNANRGHVVILEFSCSKVIGIWQSSRSEMSRDGALLI